MLFRKEALDARKTRLYGAVFIAVPLQFWVVALFLLGLLLAVVVFFATASFARMETVRGAVVPAAGIVTVRAPGGGVLRDFRLGEAQPVKSGEVVGHIVSAEAARGAGTRTGVELGRIASEIDRVRARMRHTRDVNEMELASLLREADRIKLRAERLRGLLALQRKILVETDEATNRILALAERGVASDQTVSGQRMQLIAARQDVMELEAEIADVEAQQTALAARRAEQKARGRLSILQLEAELESLENERLLLTSRQAFNVVIPVGGQSTAVLVEEGYDIRPGDTLFSILPRESALEVELYVPSRAIGFVEPGQPVKLLLDAFPFERFGAVDGVVVEATTSVILPGNERLFVSVGEPVFRVTVEMAQKHVDASGRDLPLQAGMLLSANIILEERTILAWLLDPILSVVRRS